MSWVSGGPCVQGLLLLLLFTVGMQQYQSFSFRPLAVRRRGHSVLFEAEGDDIAEVTRQALVALIEDSWARVTKLTTQSILSQCEEELRSATSMLVLATVRRAADISDVSRSTVQSMFRKADVNSDGQLTFIEWYDWLGRGGGSFEPQSSSSSSSAVSSSSNDPMVAALQQVLSQAVCALKISARIPGNKEDPMALSAAFIAGGIMAGVMDADVCRSLLGRLSPRTRELVTLALTLESASISAPQTDSSLVFAAAESSPVSARARRRVMGPNHDGPRHSSASASDAKPRSAQSFPAAVTAQGARSARRRGGEDVIQIVDLSSLVAAVAPAIDDDIAPFASASASASASSPSSSSSVAQPDAAFLSALSEAEDENDDEEEEDKEESGEGLQSLPERHNAMAPAPPPSNSAALALLQPAPSLSAPASASEQQLDLVLGRAAAVAEEIADLRLRLSDLEDNQAATMRRLLELKTGGRKDVATLAMALRATRIQHVQRLPTHLRQQLAVETLQLWAPLSFQAGVAAQVPELEVHSYVLLFPRSFNSFISWYTQLQPIARRLLSAFRLELEQRMQADELLPTLATRVTLQSRIKNPASAFKKLVRNPKQQRQQLHDMLGLRVIVAHRPGAKARATNFSTSSSSVLDAEEGAKAEKEMEAEAEAEVGGGRVLTVEGAAGRREGESEAEWTPRAVPDAAASRLRQQQGRDEGDETEAEQEALLRAYGIIQTLPGWSEDKGRFKDYVTRPKPSGYQSLHVTLVHAATLMCLEVQIRSARMHDEAENGPASHNLYKALALPPAAE